MTFEYEKFGLVPFLDRIRKENRYIGNGINCLTNATPVLDKIEHKTRWESVINEAKTADDNYLPNLKKNEGLAFGLNPYCDWSLKQTVDTPTHWNIFIGLDYYSISGLYKYPTIAKNFKLDPYWKKLWSWITWSVKTTQDNKETWKYIEELDASKFIKYDGGVFFFHNLIPYLRPSSEKSSGTDWFKKEVSDQRIISECIKDFKSLRQVIGSADYRIYCTSKWARDLILSKATGFEDRKVISWGAHPSQPSFKPDNFSEKNRFQPIR